MTIASYLLIVWKDRSWINWASPFLLITLGSKYIFQFFYLIFVAPGGSRYAYAFCYTTYALSFLAGALVYAFVKPFRIKQPAHSSETIQVVPWVLLICGFLLYLPVLIEFRAYLAAPRRIYELTRTGYGIYFSGSTTLATLGFVAFLFKSRHTRWGTAVFFLLCTGLAYWHGSKGQIVTYILIWILHSVYVRRARLGVIGALGIALTAATFLIGSFVLFSNVQDTTELIDFLSHYADQTRNAMLIVDDEHGKLYYGRLTLENEVYSRIPRMIMPNKPKDYGPFILAKIYDPAAFRNDQGYPAFDIGLLYADFGPLSIVFICAYSAWASWMISSLVLSLSQKATVGTFTVFLFMAGASVIPITGPFFLPESIALGVALTFAGRFCLIKKPKRVFGYKELQASVSDGYRL